MKKSRIGVHLSPVARLHRAGVVCLCPCPARRPPARVCLFVSVCVSCMRHATCAQGDCSALVVLPGLRVKGAPPLISSLLVSYDGLL